MTLPLYAAITFIKEYHHCYLAGIPYFCLFSHSLFASTRVQIEGAGHQDYFGSKDNSFCKNSLFLAVHTLGPYSALPDMVLTPL